jgi:uncharacterized RDD family membrane protein YckC
MAEQPAVAPARTPASPLAAYLPPADLVPTPSREYSGWWLRVASLLIDGVLSVVPLFVAFAIAGAVEAPQQTRVLHPDGGNISSIVVASLIIGWGVLLVAYFAVFNGRVKGQTLGNMAVGIAVRDVRDGHDHQTIGFWRGLLRFLLRPVFYVVVIPGLVSDLMPLWTKRHQSLADKIVKSVMVKV